MKRIGVLVALMAVLPAAFCSPTGQQEIAEICWSDKDCSTDKKCVPNGASTILDCPGGHNACSPSDVSNTNGGIFGPGVPQCTCPLDPDAMTKCPSTPCGGHCEAIACTTNTDCPQGSCVAGSCVPGCASSSDCMTGQVCHPPATGYCVDTTGSACTNPGAPQGCLTIDTPGASSAYLSLWSDDRGCAQKPGQADCVQGGPSACLGYRVCAAVDCSFGRLTCPSGYECTGTDRRICAQPGDGGACPPPAPASGCPVGSYPMSFADYPTSDFYFDASCRGTYCVGYATPCGAGMPACAPGSVCGDDPVNPGSTMCLPVETCSPSHPCPGSFTCQYSNDNSGHPAGTCGAACTQGSDCSLGKCQDDGTCGPPQCGTVYPGGRICQDDGACPSGQTCGSFFRVCGVPCSDNGGCPQGSVCGAGICVADSGCPAGYTCGTQYESLIDAGVLRCIPGSDAGTDGAVDATISDAPAGSSDAPADAPSADGSPLAGVCGATYTHLATGIGGAGGVELVGLASGALYSAGVEPAGSAAGAGWQPGDLLPAAAMPFSSIATGAVGTDLGVFGVGASDGYAYVGATQDSSGAWTAGSILPGQAVSFSALVTGQAYANGAASGLQVIGLGASDGHAYLAAAQGGSAGGWTTGFPLPNQTVKFGQLATGVGRDSGGHPTLVVIGLGVNDGAAYVAGIEGSAADGGAGTWSPGPEVPLQGTPFSRLAVGPGGNVSTPAMQIVGIASSSGLPYLAGWQDSTGTWYGGFQLSAQTVGMSTIVAALGTDTGGASALQVIGLGRSDGLPYVATWQNANGNWNPSNVGWYDSTGATKAPSAPLPNPGVPLSELAVQAAGGVVQVFAYDATHAQTVLVAYQATGRWYPGYAWCSTPTDAGSDATGTFDAQADATPPPDAQADGAPDAADAASCLSLGTTCLGSALPCCTGMCNPSGPYTCCGLAGDTCAISTDCCPGETCPAGGGTCQAHVVDSGPPFDGAPPPLDGGGLCSPPCVPPMRCLGGTCLAVCASPDTPIATPDGDVPIESLQTGDLVYSVDHGSVRAVALRAVHRTPVHDHRVERVTLENGAELSISAGHPTADGRTFGDLRAGDSLAGVAVQRVEEVPYSHAFTYDILPDSDSATYFAGGALIGSTLATKPAHIEMSVRAPSR